MPGTWPQSERLSFGFAQLTLCCVDGSRICTKDLPYNIISTVGVPTYQQHRSSEIKKLTAQLDATWAQKAACITALQLLAIQKHKEVE